MDIHQLVLHTTQLQAQKKFYQDLLGFTVEDYGHYISMAAGETTLTFLESDKSFRYHFAFLIPENQLDAAIQFCENIGLTLLPFKGNDIIDFKTGKAIYFYDADSNIVEFIIRPSLGFASAKPFSIQSIIAVNEIGVPVNQTIDYAKKIISDYDIFLVEGPSSLRDSFCWTGDYKGVFIVVKEGRAWLPTNHPSVMNDFLIRFSSGEKVYQKKFESNLVTEWDGSL